MNVQYLIFFLFLFFFDCYFHAWALGFLRKPHGNGGEITPQIHEQDPNGSTVNLIAHGDGI